MSRTTRGLAALCAVAALGGAASVSASAAPLTRGATAVHAVHARATATALQVFPTGDGPGDAEVCGAFKDNIGHQADVLADDLQNLDLAGAAGQVEAISNLVGMAEDAGCAVIL